MVIVPERESVDELAETVTVTLPLPDPDVWLTLTQPRLSETVQLVLDVTVIA